MNLKAILLITLSLISLSISCKDKTKVKTDNFMYEVDELADIQILRYKV